MVFAAGKCNFGVVPGLGICTLFLSPTVGFSMNIWPDRGAFAAFQNKMTNARQMPSPGGGGMDTLGIDSAIINTRKKCASVSPITVKTVKAWVKGLQIIC